MTIADILQLPDDAIIDRIEARGKFFAQDTTGGATGYTAQNGTIKDATGEIRIRVTNAAALPDNVPLELTITAGENNRDGSPCGLIRRTFRETPQVYTTGKAIIEHRIAPEADQGPPAEPDGRPLPEPEQPEPALDIDIAPARTAAADAPAAPADVPATVPAPEMEKTITDPAEFHHPPDPAGNGADDDAFLEEHYLAAIKMAQRISEAAGVEFEIELAIAIAYIGPRKNFFLKHKTP